MKLRTELGKVRGLGAAGSGTDHWWLQRVTAIANVPLMIWLVASLVLGVGADYQVFTAWISQPLVGILLLLLICNSFIHWRLGLMEVVNDYLHKPAGKITALVAVNFFAVGAAAAAIFAVLKLSFNLAA